MNVEMAGHVPAIFVIRPMDFSVSLYQEHPSVFILEARISVGCRHQENITAQISLFSYTDKGLVSLQYSLLSC
jgi:hypothetical protein